MSVRKDLNILLEANVITKDTADKILAFYQEQESPTSSNRLFVAFAIFGALLISLGLILIVAHNWDQFSLTVKTVFAFCPLVISQVLAGYCLLRKSDAMAWKEGTATSLIFCLGACMAMISQIYQIAGSLESFLLTWILLSVPVVYIMHSSMASLLCIAGITIYGSQVNYWSGADSDDFICWLLLITLMPYYLRIWRSGRSENFVKFHHWVFPLAIVILLGSVADESSNLMFLTYVALFAVYYLLGRSSLFIKSEDVNNGYLALGFFGTVGILLALSFSWFWKDLREQQINIGELLASQEFLVWALLSIVACMLLVRWKVYKSWSTVNVLSFTFLVFPFIYALGYVSPAAVLLINLLLLLIGVSTIRSGAARDHLGILNLGMLVITALIVCRFFDTNISFVLRGVLFVCVGIGFFIANHLMLKRRGTQ